MNYVQKGEAENSLLGSSIMAFCLLVIRRRSKTRRDFLSEVCGFHDWRGLLMAETLILSQVAEEKSSEDDDDISYLVLIAGDDQGGGEQL